MSHLPSLLLDSQLMGRKREGRGVPWAPLQGLQPRWPPKSPLCRADNLCGGAGLGGVFQHGPGPPCLPVALATISDQRASKWGGRWAGEGVVEVANGASGTEDAKIAMRRISS